MLNTKDIKTGGEGKLPKLLQPGNQSITIHSITLEDFKFKPGGLHIILHAEGEDQGQDFEGFFIDKNNESLGRYKGQVGRIKSSEYAFADGETKSGIPVSRDADMLKMLKNLCTELDCLPWLDTQDGKHPTIESLFTQFEKDKPFKGKWLRVCIGGKEYLNKEGYTNYDLFFPKYSKDGSPFETLGKAKPRVVTFDTTKHIVKKKNETIASFDSGNGGTPEIKGDFKL